MRPEPRGRDKKLKKAHSKMARGPKKIRFLDSLFGRIDSGPPTTDRSVRIGVEEAPAVPSLSLNALAIGHALLTPRVDL